MRSILIPLTLLSGAAAAADPTLMPGAPAPLTQTTPAVAAQAVPAALAQHGTATLTAVATAPRPKPKLICQSFVPTGSRLGGQKICLTAADWQQRQTQDQDWTNRAARTGRIDGNN